jgi:ceramide glucosyltransferase
MIHFILKALQIVAILGCASSSIYYLLCLWSAAAFLHERRQSCGADTLVRQLPVSILKPLKDTDPEIYESFRSHCRQDYPEYEIIFGVNDPDDPAVASVQQLRREFPDRSIQLVVSPNKLGANVKVSNLEQMVATARHPYLLVNDSDIQVDPDYLRRVMAPLVSDSVNADSVTDEPVGMVTCLYRGIGAPTLYSRLESLGISTDFCPGVLVARQLEHGLRFGLGSTMAFRRADLDRIGGFKSIVDFLADDYELGRRIAALGLKVVLSDVVVETHLPAYDLRGFLSHQLRWARGVRDSRAGGYIGLVSTYGLMWGLLAAIAAPASPWSLAALGLTVLLRVAVALTVGKSVLHDATVVKNLWLLPLRDLVAVAIWVASFAGHTVTWRGDRFRLKKGRLTRV